MPQASSGPPERSDTAGTGTGPSSRQMPASSSGPHIVSVWLERAAASANAAAPVESGMKKSVSTTSFAAAAPGYPAASSSHARPASAKPRVSYSPTTSLTASIGAQLAKHAAYLAQLKNQMLRASDTGDGAGDGGQKRRGLNASQVWGKGVFLKAYQARGVDRRGVRTHSRGSGVNRKHLHPTQLQGRRVCGGPGTPRSSTLPRTFGRWALCTSSYASHSHRTISHQHHHHSSLFNDRSASTTSSRADPRRSSSSSSPYSLSSRPTSSMR